ncbi:DUF5654 family protein [Patescibacteria group bacterium]|nr:DUF5654 family protein [Patescibacteria group bacterium]
MDKKKGKENSLKRLRKEAKEKTTGYILAALGLVAGLAWNDAVKSLIDYLFPLSQNTLFAKFIYALIITIFVVFVGMNLARITKKDEE